MKNRNDDIQINSDYVVEDLLEQIKVVSKEKAYQVSVNKMLANENQKIVQAADEIQKQNAELIEKVKKLESLLGGEKENGEDKDRSDRA